MLGVPQALGRPPARPTEHAFRRGFALPAVAFSCTSAQKINPLTTLKEAQTKQKTLKYFRPRRVIITQGRSFALLYTEEKDMDLLQKRAAVFERLAVSTDLLWAIRENKKRLYWDLAKRIFIILRGFTN